MKVFCVVSLALLCVACGGPKIRLHNAAAAKLDDGWTELDSQDRRVSIGIPPTFHSALDFQKPAQLDLGQQPQAPPPDEGAGSAAGATAAPSPGDAQADAAMKRFANDLNQESAKMEDEKKKEVVDEMAKRNLIIWAWLNGAPNISEGRTEIAVTYLPNAGGSSLEDAMAKTKSGMSGDAKVEKVSLPIGDAMKAESDNRNVIGDEVTEIRYVLLDNGDKYVISFSATNGPEQVESIADPVMQSLRIKPKD